MPWSVLDLETWSWEWATTVIALHYTITFFFRQAAPALWELTIPPLPEPTSAWLSTLVR